MAEMGNGLLVRHSDGNLAGYMIEAEHKSHRGVYPYRFITARIPKTTDTIDLLAIQSPARAIPEFSRFFPNQFSKANMEGWNLARAAGLPVPEEMMTISDSEIAIFDVLNKGKSSLYGRLEEEAITDGESDLSFGSSVTNAHMRRFNLNRFYQEVDDVVTNATRASIQLPAEDIHLIMHEDGTNQIMILNCENIKKRPSKNLDQYNHNMGLMFKSYINSVFYYLQRHHEL